MMALRKFAPLVLALAAAGVQAAPAIESTTGATLVSAANPQLWGWVFTLDGAVQVDALGAYDAGGDGFDQAHDVGLYALPGGQLVATATLQRGSGGTLEGDYRYKALPQPVTLPAGDYAIVITMPRSSPDVAPGLVAAVDFGPGIQYAGYAFEIQRARPRLALPPVTRTSSTSGAFFHATFRYTPLAP